VWVRRQARPLTSPPRAAGSYDTKGNLTNAGACCTFAYDAENRMISAANDIGFAYDARGWRKSKTLCGTATIYVTDADNRELLEYNGTNGQVIRRYVYGSGIDEALNQVEVANASGSRPRLTLIPDIQGSVIGTLDSTGAAVTKTGYKPFGESATATGSYRYTGRRIDSESGGLYYYRARHYYPAWGRFIQPDPIGLAGGNNLYAYVDNDPLNFVDPSGEVREASNRAVQFATAFGEGAWSVPRANYYAVRHVARGTGMMGSEELARFNQEAHVVDMAVCQYSENPAAFNEALGYAVKGLDTALSTSESLRRYVSARVAGRVAAGVILTPVFWPVGPLATIGDTVRAVESGHDIVDAVVYGGALGHPHSNLMSP
jgi:RHS repeat-associated protein